MAKTEHGKVQHWVGGLQLQIKNISKKIQKYVGKVTSNIQMAYKFLAKNKLNLYDITAICNDFLCVLSFAITGCLFTHYITEINLSLSLDQYVASNNTPYVYILNILYNCGIETVNINIVELPFC